MGRRTVAGGIVRLYLPPNVTVSDQKDGKGASRQVDVDGTLQDLSPRSTTSLLSASALNEISESIYSFLDHRFEGAFKV